MSDDRAFIIGVDLGQAADFTALVVVEKLSERGVPEATYALRHLERVPLGTSYPEIVKRIEAIADRLPEEHRHLVVDATGVGRAVIDLLRQGSLFTHAVTIHGGDAVTEDGTEHRVPKRDLVGTTQVILQTRRLKIPRALPLADVLVRELQSFKVKIDSKTAHDSYSAWREGDHDDLVLALAIALWFGERHVFVSAEPPGPPWDPWSDREWRAEHPFARPDDYEFKR